MTIVEAAKKYVGVRESTPAHNSLIDKYNSDVSAKYGTYRMNYTDPWCASFASLCAVEAGIKNFPFSANCQTMVNWARNKGAWSNTPSIGGLALYDWDGDGVADHVGIVTSVVGASFTTIEGNTSNMCAYRNYNLTTRGVMGFITISNAADSVIVKPPVIKFGSKGVWVAALQALLIAHGHSCGKSGADGHYGNGTLNALTAFQKQHKLTVDGVCGPKTWVELTRC